MNTFEELTREQIYDLVWTTPLAKLVTEFGVSDVALKKRCRKLSIPTPGRGYWAKIEHGQTPKRAPLPATIGHESPQIPASAHHTPWPRDLLGLCDRAQSFLGALKATKPNYRKQHKLETPLYPKAEVSAGLLETAARVFHAILVAVEATGVPFLKSRSKYEGGYFEHKYDRVYVDIEEELKTVQDPYVRWEDRERPTGRLKITARDRRYGGNWKKEWIQGTNGGLREIVGALAAETAAYFAQRTKERAEEAERQRIAHEKWLVAQEERKRVAHADALAQTVSTRAQDFFRAVEWSHLHERALRFIETCESNWRAAGPLTPEQLGWLEWARQTALSWSPSSLGYPDPSRDGPFDPTSVPFGGPYPAVRDLPRPPTMPKIPDSSSNTASWSPAPKEPYPFWLKHPR